MRISRSNKARVIITMGDPSGVGPEVALKALASPEVKGLADFLLIGDAGVLARTARNAGCRRFDGVLDMANVSKRDFRYGKSTAAYGRAAIDYIDMACELIAHGEADALVTAPINKSSVRLAGMQGFQGHTEYLAARFNVKNFAMLFVGRKMKVSLITRHLPLKAVSAALRPDKIRDTIELTYESLRKDFGIRSPRICVCGLNPHAGESGAFGDEERRVIAPAIRAASRYIKNIHGPIPADVAFYDLVNKKYDAVVAMYHDQGLVPFKMLYFERGVNMTVGLPFVRTSPDHGTGFDIAGRGIAKSASMIEAIRLACSLSKS